MGLASWSQPCQYLTPPEWAPVENAKAFDAFTPRAKVFAGNASFVFNLAIEKEILNFRWECPPEGFFSLSMEIPRHEFSCITREYFPSLNLSVITDLQGRPMQHAYGRMGASRNGHVGHKNSQFTPYMGKLSCGFDTRDKALPLLGAESIWFDIIIDAPPENGITIADIEIFTQRRRNL